MRRANLRDHLTRARAHVALGEHNIDRQREVLKTLGRGGHNTFEAEKLLRKFEDMQQLQVADVRRFERELADKSRKAAWPF